MRSRGARRGLTIVVVLVLVSILLAGVFLLPDKVLKRCLQLNLRQEHTSSLTTAKPWPPQPRLPILCRRICS